MKAIDELLRAAKEAKRNKNPAILEEVVKRLAAEEDLDEELKNLIHEILVDSATALLYVERRLTALKKEATTKSLEGWLE